MADNIRELSMDEMDKVSGGAGPIETLHNILLQAGVAPAVYSLPLKEAVQVMCEHLDQHGLSEYKRYANPLYHTCCP